MAEYDNQGLWVQCLLGPEHYQRYLQQKKKLEADIKKFRVDCDATMSEQNALTTVKVDLTNVD
jgi:hypothetical protein